jgi:ComF family protein
MLTYLQQAAGDLLHLFYPYACAGCGEHLSDHKQSVCLDCLMDLSPTGFEHIAANPVEKIFYGRLRVRTAFAAYYFIKNSPLQQIIHAFKYQHHREVCLQMGILMGQMIKDHPRINPVDFLVPMPIHTQREKKRGYNQASVFCEGITQVTGIPVQDHVVQRVRSTETQTHKGRGERWINVQSGFIISDPSVIEQKNILLVDDVITTGATLEACGEVILKAGPASLSIASLAWASE